MSWLTYAFRLMYLPIGLFGVSIAHGGAAGGRRATRRSTTRAAIREHRVARAGADADAERAGDARPDRRSPRRSCSCCSSAGGSCRPTRPRPRRRCSFYAIGLVGYSAARIASPVFYALGRQPRAGRWSAAARLRVNVVAERGAGRVHGISRVWRSAPRSRRSPTAACCCCCCGAGSAGSTAVACRSRSSRVVVASVVMAVAAVAIQHAMVRRRARVATSSAQASRLGAAIGGGLVALAADGEDSAHSTSSTRLRRDAFASGYESCSTISDSERSAPVRI